MSARTTSKTVEQRECQTLKTPAQPPWNKVKMYLYVHYGNYLLYVHVYSRSENPIKTKVKVVKNSVHIDLQNASVLNVFSHLVGEQQICLNKRNKMALLDD